MVRGVAAGLITNAGEAERVLRRAIGIDEGEIRAEKAERCAFELGDVAAMDSSARTPEGFPRAGKPPRKRWTGCVSLCGEGDFVFGAARLLLPPFHGVLSTVVVCDRGSKIGDVGTANGSLRGDGPFRSGDVGTT